MPAEERIDEIAELLSLASRTHEAVFHYENGQDPDWASFYSEWLVSHSPLGELLGDVPVRAHLTAALVELDRRFATDTTGEPWQRFYAGELVRRFGDQPVRPFPAAATVGRPSSPTA